MSRGPIPSRLQLLSSLPSRAVGDKVRFLGCVTSYSTALGCLSLGHLYPLGTDVTVLVDVNLILESLTSEKTRVGEYVNVIGYITSKQAPHAPDTAQQETAQVLVQALMLWSTGPMDIRTYEKSVDAGKPGQRECA
ncbi:CST complex subunit Ten1 [Ilyonectria robusta]|uniref:CST complex subunit Ten1 n=1 Tax=Ilyonectria robusta TaxID=1079257 RepID=UPI001E8EDB54|nr:CST complex subunit Ten1 [Ilyonectria robusta]KAH8699678.1 CST complex subunit Ten1 [Ilyonectria robusta]